MGFIGRKERDGVIGGDGDENEDEDGDGGR